MIFDSTVPRISHASIRQIDSGHAEYEIFTISTILNFTYSRQSSGEKISIHTFVPEHFIFRDHDDLIQNSDYGICLFVIVCPPALRIFQIISGMKY